MPVNETLPTDIERRLASLGHVIAEATPDVDFADLFGSAVTGGRTPRSDIDVAIYVSDRADTFQIRLTVAHAVAKYLGTDAIDVVPLNSLPISVAGRVLASRWVLLDRVPFARHRYESLTARMFQDFRIREHRMLAERRARG